MTREKALPSIRNERIIWCAGKQDAITSVNCPLPAAATGPLDKQAVSHGTDGITAVRDLGIVRDEDDRLAVFLG